MNTATALIEVARFPYNLKQALRTLHPAMYTLNEEQLADYKRNGYLLVRATEHGFFPDPNVLPQWSEEVRTWPLVESRGKWMPYFEDTPQGQQIMRTEKFMDYHDGFRGLLQGDPLRGVLAQLNGQSMQLFKDKINYKLPGGGGFGAHLDAPAYDHISKVEHVTANIAIHPATRENGCLEVVAGSHKMKPEFVTGGHLTPEWCASHEWIPVPLETGDILFFGSHLAHRSGPNGSSNPRAMLYATYAAEADGPHLREDYYADRRIRFPPDFGESSTAKS